MHCARDNLYYSTSIFPGKGRPLSAQKNYRWEGVREAREVHMPKYTQVAVGWGERQYKVEWTKSKKDEVDRGVGRGGGLVRYEQLTSPRSQSQGLRPPPQASPGKNERFKKPPAPPPAVSGFPRPCLTTPQTFWQISFLSTNPTPVRSSSLVL